MHITSFGEILWDNFAHGKILGGAPLNVMVRLAQLGAQTSIISACGNDEDGKALCGQVAALGVATHLIQTNALPTSLVNVMLDDKGSATYDIVYPCAWDDIAASQSALDEVATADALVFGSLATRDERSRQTLKALLERAQESAKFKIFDVNLRAPHYDFDQLLDFMRQADLLKLNDDELFLIAQHFGSSHKNLERNIEFLAQLTQTKALCITLGSHGAVFWVEGKTYYCAGYRVDVVDTVGAGDSFFGAFLWKYLQQPHEPQSALDFGCAVGAMVAARAGATPMIHADDIQAFMQG